MNEIGFKADIHWATCNIPGQPEEKKEIFIEDAWGNVAFLAYDLERRLRIGYFDKNTFIEIEHGTTTAEDVKDKLIYCICRKRYKDPLESAKRIYAKLKESDEQEYNKKIVDPLRYGPSVIPLSQLSKEKDYEIRGGLGVWPYIPVQIIEALRAPNVELLYLVITEGEKKAIVACNHTMWVVAIPGILVWKSKDKDHMHPEISHLIKTKKPKSIMFLTDGDTLSVNYTDQHKDLSKRPNDFLNAMEKFKMHMEMVRTKINLAERSGWNIDEEE